MPASIRAGWAGVAVLAAVAGGCGGPPAVAEVDGTVTLGGKPVAGAEVYFYPVVDGGDARPTATALTDDAGRYVLACATGQPGAVVGKHRVAVSYPPPPRGDDPDRPPPRRPAVEIPIQFTVLSTSPLVVEVVAGGRQTIDLKLDARPARPAVQDPPLGGE